MSSRSMISWSLILFLAACSDGAGDANGADGTGSDSKDPITADGGNGGDEGDEADVVHIPVTGQGATLFRFSGRESWEVEAVPSDTDWDLAFTGWDVRTNGAVSGPGKGSAMGPFERDILLDDAWPNVPFTFDDHIGGAFTDWYYYDFVGGYVLYSRYHVYGVRRGDDLFKVQILGYYGDIAGAPVSALYSLRYARLAPTPGETITVTGIDGTASGVGGYEAAPAECLDLASGKRFSFTPEQAAASSEWHLCFRRDSITVNGELGGPGNVGAVNLDAASLQSETLDEIKARTAESELARFEALDASAFAKASFRGDRIVSAFDGEWADFSASPPVPTESTWAVIAADGESRWLLKFLEFDGATAEGPGIVKARIKRVQ